MLVAAVVVASVMACSGKNNGGGGGSGGSGGGSSGGGTGGGGGDLDAGQVTISVSGSYTGTRTSDSNIFSHSSVSDTTEWTIVAMGTPFTTGGGIILPGSPTVRTYSPGDGLNCSLSVSDNPNMKSWKVQVNSPGIPDAGTCYANLTTVGPPFTESSELTWYVVHGTVQATMIADPNTTATGTVDVTYSF
jgi:hypothetical protein